MAEMEKIVDSERVPETPPGVIEIKPGGARIDGARLEAFSFSREFGSAWDLVCGEGYRCLAVPLAAVADVLQSTMLPPAPGQPLPDAGNARESRRPEICPFQFHSNTIPLHYQPYHKIHKKSCQIDYPLEQVLYFCNY